MKLKCGILYGNDVEKRVQFKCVLIFAEEIVSVYKRMPCNYPFVD